MADDSIRQNVQHMIRLIGIAIDLGDKDVALDMLGELCAMELTEEESAEVTELFHFFPSVSRD